jgi:isoquinoline 1-oxidoreductase subunit beta
MSAPTSASRRRFLQGLSALTLAVGFRGGLAIAAEIDHGRTFGGGLDGPAFSPNAFIRISADGQVSIVSSYLEMGQGTHTGLASLAAEELDVRVDQVVVIPAPADQSLYANPVFGIQGTGGSSAMTGAWKQMRHAAAAARAMLVSAAGRRLNVPTAELTVSDGVVVHAASGRRVSYGDVALAANSEEVPKEPVLKSADTFKIVGRENAAPRVDIPAKVNGSAVYTQDMKLPGMLVAVVAFPPQFWSTIRSIDASKTKRIPGVVGVVEVPGDDEIRAGVAVLAKNTWVARQGRDALEIQWNNQNAFKLGSDQIFRRYRELSATPGVVASNTGTVLKAAPTDGHFIDAVYEQPYLAHAAMEPMNCLVWLRDNRCDMWNGEQWHTADQAAAAKELGLAKENVQLHSLYAGGSFGRRANPRSDFVRTAVRIAQAAKKQGINVPIKLVFMREDDMRAGQYRPLTVHRVRTALDAKGQVVSWHHTVVGQSFVPSASESAVDKLLMEGSADTPYAIPNYRAEQHVPPEMTMPVQWLRSVGHTHSGFVGETMIDELATLAGKDPYQFRRDLLKEDARHRGVLDLVAQRSGWNKPLKADKDGRPRGRGIAVRKAFGTYIAQVAEVTMHGSDSFSVDRVFCAVDCGTVINPDIVRSQMEGGIAFALSFLSQAITLDEGRVRQGNFNDYPVLRLNSMPLVDVAYVHSSMSPTGVGEPGVPTLAPAVANAIAMASGQRLRRLPFGPSLRLI